mgnify:FL=1
MIKPAQGYVLIQPEEADEVSAGGVLLPDRVKDMPVKGKILKIGGAPVQWYADFPNINHNEIRSMFFPFEEGDTVIFKRFVDNRIKEEGKELLLVPFSDILAIYEK